MKIKFTKTKAMMIVVLLVLCFALSLKLVIDNRIALAGLAQKDKTVSTERLDKDIDTILYLYGLKKDHSELLESEGDSIYDMYYKGYGANGKSIFISVDPILVGSSRNYTEIETLMEIWLYVMERDFEYEIDGITYYFTCTDIKSIFSPLAPNEMYMSRDEFMTLYEELNIEDLAHHKKVKVLTDAYVKKSGYKRNSGHIQVR